jgi:hypothetical protein
MKKTHITLYLTNEMRQALKKAVEANTRGDNQNQIINKFIEKGLKSEYGIDLIKDNKEDN